MFGGVADVQPGQVPLPLAGLGGLVVQPDGGSQAAGVGAQGEREAGGVAEADGDLALPGVQSLLGEQVGLGDPGLADRQPLQDPPVRRGAARDGLQVAEVGAGQSQAGRGVGAESVGRFQYDEAAPGADQGGTGPQQFLRRVGEGARTGQPFGQFVQRGQVGDPAGQPVLEEGARCGGGGRPCDRCDRRDSVCRWGNR
ncbi:hypothetical protein SFUMM280S_00590 [Streptomyces fumanus]